MSTKQDRIEQKVAEYLSLIQLVLDQVKKTGLTDAQYSDLKKNLPELRACLDYKEITFPQRIKIHKFIYIFGMELRAHESKMSLLARIRYLRKKRKGSLLQKEPAKFIRRNPENDDNMQDIQDSKIEDDDDDDDNMQDDDDDDNIPDDEEEEKRIIKYEPKEKIRTKSLDYLLKEKRNLVNMIKYEGPERILVNELNYIKKLISQQIKKHGSHEEKRIIKYEPKYKDKYEDKYEHKYDSEDEDEYEPKDHPNPVKIPEYTLEELLQEIEEADAKEQPRPTGQIHFSVPSASKKPPPGFDDSSDDESDDEKNDNNNNNANKPPPKKSPPSSPPSAPRVNIRPMSEVYNVKLNGKLSLTPAASRPPRALSKWNQHVKNSKGSGKSLKQLAAEYRNL
jgi:hypothetical protein